jgi:hypothetical protein
VFSHATLISNWLKSARWRNCALHNRLCQSLGFVTSNQECAAKVRDEMAISPYSWDMTSQPTDYDALAKRYLDLWQQEMAKLAQDPQAAGAWANLFQGMMQNATAAWGQASAPGNSPNTSGFNFGGLNHERAAPSGSPINATRPTASSASSGDGGLAVADVLRRIDARLESIEQRLSALETHPPARRRTRQPKP